MHALTKNYLVPLTGGISGANEAQAESCPHEKSSLDDTLEEFCVAHEEEHLGRGCRTKKPSSRLRDFVTNTIQVLSPSDSSPSPPSSSLGSPYPIAHYVNCDKFSLAHRAFLAAVEQEKEPMTYSEAVKDHRW